MADASIYNMIRPPQPAADPVQQYGKMLQLRGLMGQQEMQAMQMDQLRRAQADEDVAREVAREAGGDLVKMRDLFNQRGLPQKAMAIEDAMLKRRKGEADIGKTEADTGKARAETLLKQTTYMRDRLAGVQDQAGYNAWLEEGARLFGPDVARTSPPQFSPEVKNALLMKADDLIVPLSKQLEIASTRRGQDLTAATARRGQDVSAATQRRGQDVSAATQRRGQDLTEARERDIDFSARRQAAITGAKETAEQRAAAVANLPKVLDQAERASRLIDEMIGTAGRDLQPGERPRAPHPGFTSAVGATYVPGARFVEGSDTADFMARLKELTGGAFLQAYETLKGGGQITQIEGEKATQAITRMDKSQSEAEFVRAAREFQRVINSALKRARAQAGGTSGGASGGWAIREVR